MRYLFATFLLLAAANASAQDVPLGNAKLENGEFLLAAQVADDGAPGFANTEQVCFRVEGATGDLGCASLANQQIVAVGNDFFQAFGRLVGIRNPVGTINRVGFIRTALPMNTITQIRVRSVSATGLSSESDRLIVADTRPPAEPPRAPTPLEIFLDDLSQAIEKFRASLAASE